MTASGPTALPWTAPAGLFGNTSLTGIVIHVAPPQLMQSSFEFGPFILKAALVVAAVLLFGSVALVVVLSLALASLVLSFIFGNRVRSGGPSFFKSVMVQVVGFFLTTRLLSRAPMVPVTHVRLRDSGGVEHLVRIEGYIQAGGLSVGDDVTIQGKHRRGTWHMRRGWNHRVRAEIRIKRR